MSNLNRSQAGIERRRATGRVRESNRYYRRKASGLCGFCGGEKDRLQVACSKCETKSKSARKAHQKEIAAKNRNLYAQQRKENRCTKCGDNNDRHGLVLCSSCWRTSKERAGKRCKIRRANDIEFRVAANLRSRLGIAMRDYRKGTRKKSSVRDLGCTIGELCAYLEGMFASGMSWDNRGQWHIDHIKPLRAFDLADPEQQANAVHFTNLQPLWARDNIVKSDKVSD